MKLNIKFTEHCKNKLYQRKIPLEQIKKVLTSYDFMEIDKFDTSVFHFIKKISGKFLRVIAKQIENDCYLIITAFFDRRLLRRFRRDTNKL